MAQRGVVVAVTISVLSMKCLLIVPCVRHRAPHRCGDLDLSRTIGLTYVVFSLTRVLNVSGKSINMVPFPFVDKLLVYDQVIKLSTMRHGFIYISSIGTTNGTIKRTTTGTSVLRNDQRVLDMELKNVISAKF